MKPNWFKNAVIYGIEIGTFQDSDGDGIGDIRGLIERLDYISELGANCLWILPFYPSPRRDNGYDVSNYFGIDERYGTMEDFRDLIQETSQRGIRVMIDLVMQHTSDKHPWFEAARSDRKSSFRDYYIWTDKLPKTPTEESFFPEVESGVWRYDNISKSYFRHGFYHFQPDLNFANPKVRQEVFSIVDFWLSLGVSGFRVDAANLIIGRKSLPNTEVPNSGEFWKEIRDFMVKRQPEAVLLAEANVDIGDINDFVLDGTGIPMMLNFWTNQTMIYALASGEAKPLMDTLDALPVMSTESQYVNFLRNLDELNIERLSDSEQKKVYQKFGYNKHMQIYKRGIRRRLAPMLRGDLNWLKLAYSLLFSMPGTPLIVYGDEIGMGDNLALKERNSVRTPMQWSDTRNGGFSSAEGGSIIERAITSPHFNHTDINVSGQVGDQDSLLNFIRRLVKLRLSNPIIGVGHFRAIATDKPNIVAFAYTHKNMRLLTFHNLSEEPIELTLDQKDDITGLKEVFSDKPYEKMATGRLKLNGYGWRWFAHG